MAAISPVANRSFAQTAALKPATPIAASAPTAVPALVPYSGAVIAGDGKTFAAESGVTFQLYKDEVGGEALWTETQTVAIDSTGHYKVQLGAANPNGLPSDLFASGEARWLEVQVAGEPPQPRVLLVSVPYALKAADAATLGGLPASAFALARPASEAVAAASPAITPNVTSNVTTTGGTLEHVPEFSGTSSIVNSPIICAHRQRSRHRHHYSHRDPDRHTVPRTSTEWVSPVLPQGTATASGGFNSQFIKLNASAFNSSTTTAVSPRFQWQAEANRQRHRIARRNAEPAFVVELRRPHGDRFLLNTNGTIHFAPGQTFPGTGIRHHHRRHCRHRAHRRRNHRYGHAQRRHDQGSSADLGQQLRRRSQAITGADLSLGSTFNANIRRDQYRRNSISAWIFQRQSERVCWRRG